MTVTGRRLNPSRLAVALLAALAAGTATPLDAWPAGASSGPSAAPATATDIVALAASLWPEAERAGIARALFTATFAGLTPDPSVAAMTRRQPEFAKPAGAYIAGQVTPARITAGRALLARWGDDLARIESRTSVPAAIVVAIWGLETNYGAATGDKDVIRSLATLAAMNYRPDLYRAELIAALKMLQDGDVTRAALLGSWAGAMGQPQFMPSSFLAYAVDADGDGRRDIWGSVPDALASIAAFIQAKGWQPDQDWGLEVRVPAGADLAASHGTFRDWAARGFVRADGSPLPAGDGSRTLFFPAGSAGPAFLVTANFEVLKTYNFSDAYVLSIAELADRMQGGPAFRTPWPTAIPMAKPARMALQGRLAALGLPVDNREGRISLALRDTIRAAQARVGLVPDGNPTDQLLQRLEAVREP